MNARELAHKFAGHYWKSLIDWYKAHSVTLWGAHTHNWLNVHGWEDLAVQCVAIPSTGMDHSYIHYILIRLCLMQTQLPLLFCHNSVLTRVLWYIYRIEHHSLSCSIENTHVAVLLKSSAWIRLDIINFDRVWCEFPCSLWPSKRLQVCEATIEHSWSHC